MATKYKGPGSDESPSSPTRRSASPPVPRPLPTIDQFAQAREVEASWREPTPRIMSPVNEKQLTSPPRSVGEERLRMQQESFARSQEKEQQEIPRNNPVSSPRQEQESRLRQAKELELKAREAELRKREEDLLARQQRALTSSPVDMDMDSRRSPTPQAIQPRERRTSLQLKRQRTQSQTDQLAPLSSASYVRSQPRYSASSSHLAPPLSPSQNTSRSSEDGSNSGVPGHSDICGCERCSIVKYRVPQSSSASSSPQPSYQHPTHLRPANPEKPKGWMRRLSMPVVVSNAFSDSKHKPSPSQKGIFSLDGKKGGGMRGGGPSEDGRYSLGAGISGGPGMGARSSYNLSNNRSSTSLGMKR